MPTNQQKSFSLPQCKYEKYKIGVINPKHRTVIYNQSFTASACRFWNSLSILLSVWCNDFIARNVWWINENVKVKKEVVFSIRFSSLSYCSLVYSILIMKLILFLFIYYYWYFPLSTIILCFFFICFLCTHLVLGKNNLFLYITFIYIYFMCVFYILIWYLCIYFIWG